MALGGDECGVGVGGEDLPMGEAGDGCVTPVLGDLLPTAAGVTLEGPPEAPPESQCTWTVDFSGGFGVYHIDWYRESVWVAGGSQYTASAGTEDFHLKVTVTDQIPQTEEDDLSVVIVEDPEGVCPE